MFDGARAGACRVHGPRRRRPSLHGALIREKAFQKKILLRQITAQMLYYYWYDQFVQKISFEETLSIKLSLGSAPCGARRMHGLRRLRTPLHVARDSFSFKLKDIFILKSFCQRNLLHDLILQEAVKHVCIEFPWEDFFLNKTCSLALMARRCQLSSEKSSTIPRILP